MGGRRARRRCVPEPPPPAGGRAGRRRAGTRRCRRSVLWPGRRRAPRAASEWLPRDPDRPSPLSLAGPAAASAAVSASAGLLPLADLLGRLRHHLEEVTHHAEVG